MTARDDEQAALQALGRRGLERRARAAQIALAQQQEALQREQDEPAPCGGAEGSSSQRSSAAWAWSRCR